MKWCVSDSERHCDVVRYVLHIMILCWLPCHYKSFLFPVRYKL